MLSARARNVSRWTPLVKRAVVASCFAAAAPTLALADDASDAVEIVSVNAWGLPAPIAPHRRERLPRIARWLQEVNPDVVAIQELWRGSTPYLPMPVQRRTVSGDDGLALGGRATLTERSSLHFAQARGWDVFKTKGAMRGRIQTRGGPDLWVVVTHMQAGYGRANARVREQQVDELLRWTQDLSGPIVFVGDFNIDSSFPEDAGVFRRLHAAGLVDLADSFGATEATYPGDGHRYDHILARGGAGWKVVTDSVVVVEYDDDPHTAAPAMFSDHRPLRARLHLERDRTQDSLSTQ